MGHRDRHRQAEKETSVEMEERPRQESGGLGQTEKWEEERKGDGL